MRMMSKIRMMARITFPRKRKTVMIAALRAGKLCRL
jgi:hypothetical protein